MVRAVAGSLAEVPPVAALPAPHVLRCVEGDLGAWRQLHRQYFPIAAAFLRKLGVEERDREDACQEVFLQMFRYLARFRGEADPKTWLYRLCITQARRVRRRNQLSHALQHMLAFLPGESLVSSPGFCEDTAQRRIQWALGRLSEKERSAFVLYEMEGLAGKEIAAILGCKEATLWRRLHDARREFRRALTASELEP